MIMLLAFVGILHKQTNGVLLLPLIITIITITASEKSKRNVRSYTI